MRRLRRFAEWSVYGFLAWFESFDSVWQTTLICIVGTAVCLSFPGFVSLTLFVLVLSLYATFTQNGLAHENKLNSDKLDQALSTIDQVIDENYASTQALLRLAENELNLQEALAAQSDAIVTALDELRSHITTTTRQPRKGS